MDLNSHTIFNLDESLLNVNEKKLVIERLVPKNSKSVGEQGPPKVLTLASVTPVICADGKALCVLICMKSESDEYIAYPPTKEYQEKLGCPVHFTHTESGYLNKEVFTNTMENHLATDWDKYKNKHGMDTWTNCLIIMDNLAVHKGEESMLKLLEEHQICFLFLPKNTTQFSQPLDRWVFSNLRTFVQQGYKTEEYNSRVQGKKVKPEDLYWRVFYDALFKAMEPNTVRKSWADAKIWPWSEDEFYNYCCELAKLEPTPLQLAREEKESSMATAMMTSFTNTLGSKNTSVPVRVHSRTTSQIFSSVELQARVANASIEQAEAEAEAAAKNKGRSAKKKKEDG